MKKHFNKNLVMTSEQNEEFESSNICWICGKLIDIGDNKFRGHCHISGKCRGSSHWSCNINLKITKKVPVIFHNLKGYNSHLIFKELSKFNCEISVMPNGLEKYKSFTLNNNIFKKFKKSKLPNIDKSFSSLKDYGISEKEYQRACNVWRVFTKKI